MKGGNFVKSPEIAREIFRSRLGTLIRPYKKYQCRGLEKSTSIYDKVYHKWNEFAGFVLPYAGCNCFLTYHLPLDYLKANFKYYDVDDIPVTRWKTFGRKINLVGIKEFRPAQSQIISEIERSKKESNIWFVNLQTGQGKTLLSTYLSTKFNLKTLILCFSDDILTQWINTYITKTDIDERRILHLSGKVIDNILAGAIDPDDFDIFLSTPTLLDRFGSSRMDYSKITELFNKCGFGLMIYDEAHRNVSNIVKISAITNVRYQLYLSADFSQGGYEREVIYKKIFANAQVVTPSEDLKRSMNYTHIVIVDYDTYPNAIEQNEPFNKYGYSAELYMKYQFKKKTLLKAMCQVIENIRKKDKERRFLILFVNIEHVDKMYDILTKVFPDEKIGKFYSKLPDEEKEDTKNNASIIVATYSSFGTGLDTENIKYVLSPNQCNKVMDNQAAGRARPLADGTNALYFIFIDNGFSYCKRKLRIRLNYLNETKSKTSTVYRLHYIEKESED